MECGGGIFGGFFCCFYLFEVVPSVLVYCLIPDSYFSAVRAVPVVKVARVFLFDSFVMQRLLERAGASCVWMIAVTCFLVQPLP
jgi:hypothetical protein